MTGSVFRGTQSKPLPGAFPKKDCLKALRRERESEGTPQIPHIPCCRAYSLKGSLYEDNQEKRGREENGEKKDKEESRRSEGGRGERVKGIEK